eukprot:tig00020603_g11741.t1
MAEQAIVAALRKHPQGLLDDVLTAELSGVSVDERAQAINSLLVKGRLQLMKDDAGNIVYREIAENDAAKFAGLGPEELVVYQVIQQAQNNGIWTKDIRFKSSLQQTQVTKALKTLENRKLIKAVKSVASANKKVYMLFGLEPSRELTGGAFYTEAEFDAAFTAVLNEQVFQFVRSKGYAAVEDIENFIRTSGISKVELRGEDVQSVVGTLLYDGKLEEMAGPRAAALAGATRGAAIYKVSRLGMLPSALTAVPCGVCPVAHECEEGGVVSPETCQYFDEWLQY